MSVTSPKAREARTAIFRLLAASGGDYNVMMSELYEWLNRVLAPSADDSEVLERVAYAALWACSSSTRSSLEIGHGDRSPKTFAFRPTACTGATVPQPGVVAVGVAQVLVEVAGARARSLLPDRLGAVRPP